MRSLKGTETAKIRAQKAATARWKKHRPEKSIEMAVAELGEAIRNLKCKLRTLATISGESYETLIDGCVEAVTGVLRKN
jgi:hypothetical protein